VASRAVSTSASTGKPLLMPSGYPASPR
jgi:hypothetical protein